MKPGMTISCVAHAVALGFAVVAISAQPMDSPPVETLATQIISEKDFSQMTKGVKNAPQLKIPDMKPLADKVDQEKSVDQLAPKAVDKPAITTDASKSTPTPKTDTSKPDAKAASQADSKPDTKADAKADPKPDQKQADKPKPPDYKPDQIANLLKKDAAKDAAKPNDNSAQQKQSSPKFDASQVAQLLDKRDPQRQLASAATLNNNVGFGSATAAQAAETSQSENAAFIKRVQSCMIWPAGVDASVNITVSFEILLNRDGSLAAPPAVVKGPASPLGPAIAESARRALLQCQPYTMFNPEHYDKWKDLMPEFNPSVMSGD
jgi:hypothetical protein